MPSGSHVFWILASFLAPAQNEQAPLSGKVETFDEKNGPALDSGQSQKVLKMQLFSWQVSIHLKVLLPPQSPVIVWDSANPMFVFDFHGF